MQGHEKFSQESQILFYWRSKGTITVSLFFRGDYGIINSQNFEVLLGGLVIPDSMSCLLFNDLAPTWSWLLLAPREPVLVALCISPNKRGATLPSSYVSVKSNHSMSFSTARKGTQQITSPEVMPSQHSSLSFTWRCEVAITWRIPMPQSDILFITSMSEVTLSGDGSMIYRWVMLHRWEQREL